MTVRLRRSALYMPGSNARALEKAKSLAADVFLFDLEDAVAPEVKQKARDQVVAAVKGGGFGDCELVIRVNGLRTEWGDGDLRAAAAAGPDAVLLPKISSCADVLAAAKVLREAAPSRPLPIWAMIETPLAILNVAAIASMPGEAALRPAVMVMGVNDLAKETRARLSPGREAIVPWLMSCVAAARAYDIGLLDGVWNDLSDPAGLERECMQGRNLGMDGKTLIHPSQIAVCNNVFAPEEAEIDWASKVLAEFAKPENAAKGAVQLEGRMVERLHMESAHQVLELANQARARRARA
jgi:citrate lyase subunit beta/citryl-CoA lyase